MEGEEIHSEECSEGSWKFRHLLSSNWLKSKSHKPAPAQFSFPEDLSMRNIPTRQSQLLFAHHLQLSLNCRARKSTEDLGLTERSGRIRDGSHAGGYAGTDLISSWEDPK